MKFGFTTQEINLLTKLTTPAKIQDYLDSVPGNFKKPDTCYTPRLVMRHRTAHCMEGALFAAAALRFHGHQPIIMELSSTKHDDDHVLALFKRFGYWGAITKTNHAVLRYREPVYKSIRELAMSFFHEYFTDDGTKTMRWYSKPLNLSLFDKHNWMTAEEDAWYIVEYLDAMQHYPVVNQNQIQSLRRADNIERAAGMLVEWTRDGKRTKLS